MSQAYLRQDLRDARRRVPRPARNAAAEAIRRHLATNLRFLSARRVALYMATRAELDPGPLMHEAAALGKTIYLPVMTDRLMRWRQSPLAFQRVDFAQGFVRNRYGIAEPPLDARAMARPEQLDVIFLPLLGFDREGHRIGMGQGFYDRALAGVRRRYRRPWLVGCGFAVQEVGAIIANPWDITLDAVVTEKGLIEVATESPGRRRSRPHRG